ncbi:hypothetical protein AV530_003135 [Patagioenas fasciata monilis]|uniref:Uncharacterized protein n=1 Tax=Patagioenas fasciata monilis TaxID=372326 RepID=A0A1V4KXA6_PATFA|nr:hypothetical protein AV530_003135 [Patagioenas fasciata monilis]
MGRRGGLLPSLNLHSPSSLSSPAPPFSKSRLLGPGVRCRTVCPAAPARPPPGELPRRRRCRWRIETR